MNYAVPRRILKSATRCTHRYACLKTGRCGNRAMCAPDHVCGIVFLKTKEAADCVYRMASGGRQMCMCPVRGFIAQTFGE